MNSWNDFPKWDDAPPPVRTWTSASASGITPPADDFLTPEDGILLDNLFKDNDRVKSSPDFDELILIVDRSGSMQSIINDAQGGVNSFLDQQSKEGNANITIVEFDNAVNVAVERQELTPSTKYTIKPRGTTALYDAIGFTLAQAEELGSTGRVVVAILTDGAENSSREWTSETVKDRIAQLKDRGWEFIFLSADESAFSTGASFGLGDTTIKFGSSGIGAAEAYGAMNTYFSTTRSTNAVEAKEALENYVATSSTLETSK